MQNIIQQAAAFRKAKAFQKAIDIYRKLWDKDPLQFNEWDGWSYAFCLKEMKMFAEGLDICRQLYPRFKNSAFIKNLYAQCIYYSQIKTTPLPSLSIQKKAVRAMVDLAPPHQEYSLSGLAIFHLCKALMSLQPAPWAEIESWLLIMDPDLLTQAPFRYRLPDGKPVESASHQEQWYSYMIRVKAGLNQPNELLKLLEEAKKRNIQWHYQNDIWFERKKAFAYVQLNQPEQAKEILVNILKRKKDWFLYSDLGDVITGKDEKLKYYSLAALGKGKIGMKISLFEKIANLLAGSEEHSVARQRHFLLIARIRLENGWPFQEKLEKILNEENINLNAVNSAQEVFNQLIPFWNSFAKPPVNQQKGVIDFIHGNGKSGIIKGEDGQKYFFPLSQVRKVSKKLVPGTPVLFTLKDSFDKKKNKPSKMAVNISVADLPNQHFF